MLRAVPVLAVAALFALGLSVAAADPPDVPGGLSPADGTDVRGERIALSWRAVEGAAEYRVRWSVGAADAGTTEAQVPAERAVFLLDGPFPDNTHIFWAVQARGGAWSETADFWVGRDIVPPEAPSDLVALGAADGVELRWTASPSGDAEGYRLYLRPAGGIYGGGSSLGLVTSTTVGNLVPGLSYDFMLTAVDAAGNESVGVLATWASGARVILRGIAWPTVQAAADRAVPGDTIELAAGTFLEGVSLPPGVSLRGAGPGQTILDATGASAGVTLEASDASDGALSTISSLTIRGGAAGVWGGVARVRLENVVICRAVGPGIHLDAGRLDAARVTLYGCAQDAIVTGADGLVTDAIIAGNGGAGLRALGPGLRLSWSTLFDNVLGPTAGPVQGGEGVTGVVARFENERGDDFRVPSGDPTVDAGDPASPYALEPSPNGGRVNLGAFGNTSWAAASLAPAAGSRISADSSAGSASSRADRYCVVSTAAFGSDGDGRVEELRLLRDRVLRGSGAGAAAVGTYENAAAGVARRVGRSEVLKALVRFGLPRSGE